MKYGFIERGEVIQAGDEYMTPKMNDAKKDYVWKPFKPERVGQEWTGTMPVRRPFREPNDPVKMLEAGDKLELRLIVDVLMVDHDTGLVTANMPSSSALPGMHLEFKSTDEMVMRKVE